MEDNSNNNDAVTQQESPGPEGTPVDNGSSDGAPAPVKPRRKHLIKPTWLRRTLKTLLGLVIFIVILPFLIYVPPIQDLLVGIAEKEASKATGMDISIEKFRLKFPLDVSLQNLSVVEAGGDTMVSAHEALLDVKLLPLLKLDVDVNKLRLDRAYYRLVDKDTAMIMTIRAGFLEVDDQSSVNIKESDINLNKAVIRDADISMVTDVWKKKPTPEDTTASTPFKIRIGDLSGERIRFGMASLPTIDTLALEADTLSLKNGLINLETSHISAGELSLNGGSFTFLTPDPEYVRTHPAPIDTISPPSPPMVIEGKSVNIRNFNALYGVAGARPQPGFDASYLQLSGIDITLDNFYNKESTLKLPVSLLRARERCGLEITQGSGYVALDSTGINIDDLKIRTPYSLIDVNADVPFSLMELKPWAPVNVKASLSLGEHDVLAFMPSLSKYTKLIRRGWPINLTIDAHGTLEDLDVPAFDLSLPTILNLRASGTARNPLDFKKLVARLNIDGSLTDPSLIEHFTGNLGFKIPAMQIKGDATVDRGNYGADLSLLTAKGDIAAKGKVNLNSETYDADLDIRNFNAAYFVPDIGIGIVNAKVQAKGNGFDPLKPKSTTDVTLNVGSIQYKDLTFRDLFLKADIADDQYDVTFTSPNPDLDVDLSLNVGIHPDLYSAKGYIDCRDLNLRALGLDTAANGGSFNLKIDGSASPDMGLCNVALDVDNVDWTLGDREIKIPEGVQANLMATADSVSLKLDCQDTRLLFDSPDNLTTIISQVTEAMSIIPEQIEQRDLQIDVIQESLPRFDLSFYTPCTGIVQELLADTDISFQSFALDLKNEDIITGFADLMDFKKGEDLSIDTLTLDLKQRNYLIDYKLHMGNRPGTMDEFADVNVNGYVGGNRASAYLTQKNLAGETGYKLGFTAALADDGMATIHFTPLNAIIAYRPWTLNSDNYIDLDLDKYKVEASLEASSDESSILLETRSGADDLQELHLKLTDIKVQDFLQMSVTAPPLTATVNSDIRARYDGKELVGVGRLGVSNFTYDNTKVDDLNLSLQAAMNMDGTYDASVSLAVERKKALTVSTKLISGEDGLEPEFVKLNLNRFPLSAANPFLGNDVAKLQGYLSGDMDLSGGLTKPLLNGAITCDSVSVYLPIMGSSLRFDTEPLTVKDNVVTFNSFDIWGANSNPLTINGSVDATKFNDIQLDISARANNFQLVGNDRRAGSDIYGKVFLNFSADAKGPMTRFGVDANLNILGSTDVTYAIPDANTAIQGEKDADVVRFVNFNDTTTFHPEKEAESVFMKVNAGVQITPGAQVTVLLSSNGTDRVQLNPSGNVSLYRNFMGDITLNGQLNTGNGFARYNVPVIGTKEFVFDPSSYVLWNGPMMNPTLNIHATDEMKVSISQNGGNSQLVNFLVLLNITGTLNAPHLLFDLSTDDDITIQNQLQGMTADQRNSAAMNLLITGQYSAGGISSNAGPITGNVYNFLTQQLNSWAAKNIRGVDLSFGVNQYDMTNDGQTSTATSYSYQLSKSLFNNRFKISVGGNYSTDDSPDDNLTQNLISDISFEYILRQTQTQTMLVKLFRHNGYESILEGEIVEMGGGFVYKRKLGDFKSLFRLNRRHRNRAAGTTTTATPDSVAPDTPASETKDNSGK